MKNKIIAIILIIFAITRIVYLDRDMPPCDKTVFGSKDEQAYHYTTFDLYHFGEISEQSFYVPPFGITTILNIVYSYFTMILFGNNYYGLRLGAVLASILVFIVFYKLLYSKKDNDIWDKQNFILLLVSAYLIFDFGFIASNRNADPNIFRTLYMLLIFIYLNNITDKKRKIAHLHNFLIGVISSFLIFFSYLTNPFIFFAVILFYILRGFQERNLKSTVLDISVSIGGLLFGTLLSNAIYLLVGDKGISESFIMAFTHHPSDVVINNNSGFDIDSVQLIIKRGLTNIFTLMTCSSIMLNPTLLFFILLFIYLFFLLLFRHKQLHKLQVISLSFILAYSSQSFFYNAECSKHAIIIFPVILIFIVSSIINIYKEINSNYSDSFFKYFYNMKYIIMIISSMVFLLTILRLKNSELDQEIKLLNIIGILIFLIFSIFFFRKVIIKLPDNPKILYTLLGLSILPNIYLTINYFILKPEFHYKNACITLNNKIENKIVAGVWADGFRLYTQGNIIYPWYHVGEFDKYLLGLKEIIEKKQADFSVCYTCDMFYNELKNFKTNENTLLLMKDTTLYLGKGPAPICDSLVIFKRIDGR